MKGTLNRLTSPLLLVALALTIVPLTAMSAASTGGLAPQKREQICSERSVQVTLSPTNSTRYQMRIETCLPKGKPRAVQVLVSGTGYATYYWNFPFQPERYSYAQAMNRNDVATVAYSRLGDNGSAYPNSNDVTITNDAWWEHQIVQLAKKQFHDIPIVTVGHSMGSWVVWQEAVTYHDESGVIITGSMHANSNSAENSTNAFYHQANMDPKFQKLGLDDGYYTSVDNVNGQLGQSIYYYAPDADPSVIAHDQALKGTFGLNELLQGLDIVPTTLSLGIKVPVKVIVGDKDIFGCQPDAVDCSSQQSVYNFEKPFYSPQACLSVNLIKNAGHVLNLEVKAAPQEHDEIIDWMNRLLKHKVCGSSAS